LEWIEIFKQDLSSLTPYLVKKMHFLCETAKFSLESDTIVIDGKYLFQEF